MRDSLTPPAASDNGARATSVYRYYDEYDALIYVGITNRGTSRNREHNADKQWWPFVARQEVEHYSVRLEALKSEKALIQRHRPPFNRQHNLEHETLRAAYLAFRSVERKSDPLALALELNRILPLVPMEMSNGRYVLRTLPEHAAIASRLMPADSVTVQGTGKGAGKVVGFVRQGPIALVELSKRPVREVQRAFGNLKFPKARPVGDAITLTAVQIVMVPDPEKRSPVPPRHEPWLPCLADACEKRQVYDRLCVEHLAAEVESEAV